MIYFKMRSLSLCLCGLLCSSSIVLADNDSSLFPTADAVLKPLNLSKLHNHTTTNFQVSNSKVQRLDGGASVHISADESIVIGNKENNSQVSDNPPKIYNRTQDGIKVCQCDDLADCSNSNNCTCIKSRSFIARKGKHVALLSLSCDDDDESCDDDDDDE